MSRQSQIDIHSKYAPLFNGRTRYYVVTGGRGSGKSFAAALLPCYLMLDVDQVVLFTRYTLTSAHISIIPEFADKAQLIGIADKLSMTKQDIINPATRSRIMFRGIKTSSGDQTANLKSLQGVNCWLLDEAEELTDEATFDKIDLSIRDTRKQNRVILLMNPTTKEHWIYKRFFEDMNVPEGFNGQRGDVTYIHTDYRDNAANLSVSFLQQIDHIKQTNPEKYKHVILGGWLQRQEGVIFTNWEQGEFREVNSSAWGQDYGFSIDPTTLVRVSIDAKQMLIYAKVEYYAAGMTTEEIALRNRQICRNGTIIADGSEDRLIHELRTRGSNIRAAGKGHGSVRAGIKTLQDYRLIVDGAELVKELNNYRWADKGAEVPIDNWNHAIDALRYAATWLIKQRGGNMRTMAQGAVV
jgi:phage terminase large subunit